MDFKLTQEQKTNLVMTPQLRQSIELLQLSAVDLWQYLSEQIEENPFMDMEASQEVIHERKQEGPKEAEGLYWDEVEQGSYSDFSMSKENDFHPIDYVSDTETNLQEQLLEQLRYASLDEVQSKLARYLIGNVNEEGYLDSDWSEMIQQKPISEKRISIQKWEEALSALHRFEPYGVGARSLKECLLIQLKRLGYIEDTNTEHIYKQMIEDHLQDVAYGRVKQIASALNITSNFVEHALEAIRSCHPKPGFVLHQAKPHYVIPDVTVNRLATGKYIVQVNDWLLPHITFNQKYASEAKEDKKARNYIEDKWQQYQCLVRSMDHRKMTLKKVTEAIIAHQHIFFEHGPLPLEPLTLKQIAQETNIHESTVSRAVNHKYCQTDFGIFKLKHFFASRASKHHYSDDEKSWSNRQVKQKIQAWVDQEDGAKPLSDQKIVAHLKREGVYIARRTVAKYRDQLGILSSSHRKRKS